MSETPCPWCSQCQACADRIGDLEQVLMELLAMPAGPGSESARKTLNLIRDRAAAVLNGEGATGGKL